MSRPKKERAASDDGPYLVFRYCKDECFRPDCKQCGYFWGPAQSPERVGKRATFGVKERKRQEQEEEAS